jgi:hypothetical protein
VAFDPDRTAAPGEPNSAAVDKFTAAHIAVGAGFGLLRVPFLWTLAAAIGWELLERPARVRYNLYRAAPKFYSGQDTALNSTIDVAANMAGWWLGRRLRG